jgi:long-chain fatty acid transport protein
MKQYIVVLLVLASALSAFATDGTRMVGFNAKTIGRGGTSIGVFDSPSLMMTNPGGLSFLGSSSVDAGFALMVPSLHFTNTLNDVDGKTNYFPLPGLAYVNRCSESPLTWGVGAFTQGGMGADFTLNHALYGSALQKYHSKLAVMQGGVSAAYKFTPDLSVGVSAHLVYGMLEFAMPYSLSPSMMKGIAQPGMTFGQMFAAPPALGGFGYSEVTAAADMNSLTALGFSGKIGFAYKLNDKINIGLAYTSSTTLNFKNGKAGMDMTAQLNDAFGKAVMGYMAGHPAATQAQAQGAVMAMFGGMGIDLTKGAVASYDLAVTLKLPQSLGLGVSYAAAPDLRLSCEAEWINWKNGFDVMALSLSGGANPNINTMMGNSGSFPVDFPMNWKDSYCLRVGGEYDVDPTLTLRAGFAYGSNPVPESTVFPVFPAIVESHATLGATYSVSPAITLHAAYELALNKKETASAQSLVAQEYNNSVSQLGENIFHFGLTWSLN